jgi:hypothetical protein
MREFAWAWFAAKQGGPFPFAFRFPCEDGITRHLCPPGNAYQPDDSFTWYGIPFLLWCGGSTRAYSQAGYRGPHRLYEQEEYVYRLEMRDRVKRALEQLFKVNPLPRNPGHAANEVMPFPEDFALGRQHFKRAKKENAE